MRCTALFAALFLACAEEAIAQGNGTEAATESAALDRPPAPDFDKPVDYLAWYANRHFEKDWPCGREVYPFLYEKDAQPGFETGEGLKKLLRDAYLGPWASCDEPAAVKYIKKLEPHLPAYTQAGTGRSVRWVCGAESLWEGSFPDYGAWIFLSNALLARAWMDASSVESAESKLIDALTTNFQHARHLRHVGGTLAFSSSTVVRHWNYAAIRGAFAAGTMSKTTTATLLGLLRQRDGSKDLAEAFRCDWAGLLDLLQQLYPDGRFSDTVAKRFKQDEFLPPGGIMLPLPEITAFGIDNWFSPIVELAEQPWSQVAYQQLHRRGKQRATLFSGNLFLSTYLSGGAHTYLLGMAVELERRATIVVAALHAYKKDRGEWPKSLGELESLSPTMMLDLFSDGEFRYDVRGEEPWLYSVGVDGQDDGGKHDPRAATSDRRKGYDFVFFPVQRAPCKGRLL